MLSDIRSGVREVRLGPQPEPANCAELQRDEATGGDSSTREQERDSLPPVWPYGLGIDLLIGAGFTSLAIRRLRVPAKRLPRGTRVA